MKNILLFFITFLLVGCLGMSSDYFDEDYYEKTTKIKLPKDFDVVTSADNGEFLTISIIDLNKKDCKKFIIENEFESLSTDTNSALKNFGPDLSGLAWLDSTYRNLPEKNLLVKEKSFKNGTSWKYYIDTITCRLYCQINYPDWGGK